ncbi:hypothetical protein BN1723_015273 [Verticillium longisporum]|uniref:GOLD domain-containing protein n=1 Tax=Verticillium longisporum TaxID=100787 RepID=A0A0G4MUU4_VERLO|nr:hypothetical protein BN1723_015273 [Verticillium longisporum]
MAGGGDDGSQYLSPGSSSVHSEEREGYFPSENQKRAFWKRKSSVVSPQSFQPMVSSSLAVPSPGSANPRQSTNGSKHARKKSRGVAQEEKSMQDHCGALLNDLDSVVAEFTLLIANSKRRRLPAPLSAAASRLSMDTTSTDEFFDAEVGETGSQIVRIDRSEEDDAVESDADEAELHDSSSAASTIADEETGGLDEESCYPSKPKSLTPLPVDISVERRSKIPPGLVQPPSLIGIVRKNVGKDLSNISAPVSANEPTSMLQRIAEQLEYSQLLDAAVQQKTAKDRLLYVTAFAVSQISINRSKERAIRKPFNPLLGETYELLRTEQEVPGGFRLIAEKVSHRPVRLAMQADSSNWSFSQSPAPSQKFWGKSAEIITEGRVRIALRLMDGTDELYSWTHAAMFLRNVVMGEKYVEPVGTMHVNNDTTGAKAVVEFRSKGGMFGGRGEDVAVETYTSDGSNSGTGLIGTWTTGLRRTENGKTVGDDVWKVGKLVDNAATTNNTSSTFASSLASAALLHLASDLRRAPEMAGHEQLEVHSKSYIVRWLKVEDGQSIAWTVQPHKKSINFGIVKHPGTGATNIVPSQSDDPATPSGVTSGVNDAKPARFAKKDTITAQDQLASKGFIPIKWQGRCEAETQTTGTHDVLKGQAGMYGLVFDNTFSKQTSKTVTLSLRTYPIGSPPPTAHNVPNLSLGNPAKSGSKTSLGKHGSPHMNADLEERGEEHKPKWFVKLGNGPEGEEVWKIKTGKDSYWEERTRGMWNGVTNIFAV